MMGNMIYRKESDKDYIMGENILESLPKLIDTMRAVYFEQAKNGMYIRMALLDYLVNKAVPVIGNTL